MRSYIGLDLYAENTLMPVIATLKGKAFYCILVLVGTGSPTSGSKHSKTPYNSNLCYSPPETMRSSSSARSAVIALLQEVTQLKCSSSWSVVYAI